MYKIGEFAKLSGASIRTLRFYDNIDLFKPDDIDLFTGYRYYSEKRLEEFQLIMKLKDLGFSLEEIKENLNNITESVILSKKEELMQARDNLIQNQRKVSLLKYLRKIRRKENGKNNFSEWKSRHVKDKGSFV